MDFGHFSLMGYRERGYTSRQIFTEHGEQVKLAEQAGIEFAWFAEHHFSNYCTCPTPLMMAAYCAGFTTKIRLGTAVIVAPLYNPARVLAEIGMVDAMSNGRLALGIGSGYQPYEFERFGADLAASKAMMEEFLDILELAFTQEVFSYSGKHYQLPETHISARPIDGIKEIWIAGDNEAGHRLCARRGYIPLFAGRHKGAEYFAEMRGKIEATYRAEGKDASNVPMAYQRFFCVTESAAETRDYVDNCRHQMRLASALRRRAEVMDGAMMNEIPFTDEPSLEEMEQNLLVGDCESIAEKLVKEINLGQPNQILFHMQVGASRQHQAVRTIEKFATEIRPMLEQALGPLEAIGHAVQTAAAE
jgi:alkanesulfonate monooxygenase SsuD/methylene tetrahydromethanopterin reductase-like flavin-dependent oxidoreductase (luciferase family)